MGWQGKACLLEQYTFGMYPEGLPLRQKRVSIYDVCRDGELGGVGLYITLNGDCSGARSSNRGQQGRVGGNECSVKLPSTSSNCCDEAASSNWRNVVLVMRRCVRVVPGDKIVLRSDVHTGDSKRPTYQVSVSLMAAQSGRERLLDSVKFGVPELYPTEEARQAFSMRAPLL